MQSSSVNTSNLPLAARTPVAAEDTKCYCMVLTLIVA